MIKLNQNSTLTLFSIIVLSAILIMPTGAYAHLNHIAVTNDLNDACNPTTAGADHVIGDGAYNNICGGDGNDVLTGKSGGDHMFGGEGNDIMRGDSLNDYMDGGPGNDNINVVKNM